MKDKISRKEFSEVQDVAFEMLQTIKDQAENIKKLHVGWGDERSAMSLVKIEECYMWFTYYIAQMDRTLIYSEPSDPKDKGQTNDDKVQSNE